MNLICSVRRWNVEFSDFVDAILIGSDFFNFLLSFSFEIELRLWLVENGNVLHEHCSMAKLIITTCRVLMFSLTLFRKPLVPESWKIVHFSVFKCLGKLCSLFDRFEDQLE